MFHQMAGRIISRVHPHAFRANNLNFWRQFLDGGERLRFNRKIQARGKTHGAEHPQMIFAKTFAGAPIVRMTRARRSFSPLNPAVKLVLEWRERSAREIAARASASGIGEKTPARTPSISCSPLPHET